MDRMTGVAVRSNTRLLVVILVTVMLGVVVICRAQKVTLEECLKDFSQKKSASIPWGAKEKLESCILMSGTQSSDADEPGVVTQTSFNEWKRYVFVIVARTKEGCEPILRSAMQVVEFRYNIGDGKLNDKSDYHRYCRWVINIGQPLARGEDPILDAVVEVENSARFIPKLDGCMNDFYKARDNGGLPFAIVEPFRIFVEGLYREKYKEDAERKLELDNKEMIETVKRGLSDDAQLKKTEFAELLGGDDEIAAIIDAVIESHSWFYGKTEKGVKEAVKDRFVPDCERIIGSMREVYESERFRDLSTDHLLTAFKAIQGEKRHGVYNLVNGARAYLFCSLMTYKHGGFRVAHRVRKYLERV